MRTSRAERIEQHLGLRSAELPAGMPWVYAVAAILATPVLSRNVFVLPPHLQLQAMIGNAVPFIAIPAALHSVYAVIVPGLLRRTTTPAGRVLVHAVASALTAAGVGIVIAIATSLLGWKRAPLSGIVVSSVLLTWAFLVPAKLVRAWQTQAGASDAQRRTAEEAAARNELHAIQSRAHPHFLFNVINTVASLIPEDPQRAEETLVRFAEVLRYMLETSTVATTPLAQEVAILREYLEIQRVRFEALHYSIEVDAGLDAVRTPPLLLLPLVENAVQHGVGSRGAGNVSVRIRQHGDGLSLDVEDDGPGQGGSTRPGNGIALRDLRRRLHLVYGDTANLFVPERGGNGYAVHLRLPGTGGLAP